MACESSEIRKFEGEPKKDVNKIVITDDSDGEKDEVVIYGKRFVMSDDELSITFEKVN